VGVVSTTAVAILLGATPMLAFLPPRQAPQLVEQPTEAPPLSPPLLQWAPDPAADYYVLKLYRGGRLVLEAVERSPRAMLPPSLPPGSYEWRVYAGYGKPKMRVWRGPIADADFVLGTR
jgi:hypothetical protein